MPDVITAEPSKSKTFLDTVAAARHAGLSDKQFTRATEAIGMKPMVFKGTTIEKHMWLREGIDTRLDELRAQTGQAGKAKNQPPKLPVGDNDVQQ